MLTERSVYEEAVYELGVSEICFAIVFVSLGKTQYILRSRDPHRFLVWSEIRRAIQKSHTGFAIPICSTPLLKYCFADNILGIPVIHKRNSFR